jgi:membrane protease YdiL (CAAX protease family)
MERAEHGEATSPADANPDKGRVPVEIVFEGERRPLVFANQGPRIWPALVIGPLAIGASVVVGTAAVIALIAVEAVRSGGPPSSPESMMDWVKGWMQTPIGLAALFVPGQAVFLSAAIVGGLLSPEPLAERLGLVRSRFPWWLLPLLMLGTPAVGFMSSVALGLLLDSPGEHLVMMSELFRSLNGVFGVFALLTLSVLPGMAEELLFRGYIQQRLLKAWPPMAAIGATTIVFALAHVDPIHMLAVVPLSIWLGIIAWRSGSIWPAVLCHFANNFVAVLVTRFSTAGSGFWEWDAVGAGAFIASGLALIASIAVLALGRAAPRGDDRSGGDSSGGSPAEESAGQPPCAGFGEVRPAVISPE